MWRYWHFCKRHGELKKLKIPRICPGASPLGCTPCTWIASFQEHISSPTSSQPSLPPHFSNAYSCSSFLIMSEMRSWGFFWWLMLWNIWGFFTSFTAVSQQFHGLCPEPGRGITAAPATETYPSQHSGWVIGVLMHTLIVACSWNIWVLRHKLHGHSFLHGLIGCSGIKHVPQLIECSCMKCWSAQAGPDRTCKHTLIRHLCTTDWVPMHVPVGQPCTNQLCAHVLINCVLMNKLTGCAQNYWALVCVLTGQSCINWVLMHGLLDHFCINSLSGVHGWSNFALMCDPMGSSCVLFWHLCMN